MNYVFFSGYGFAPIFFMILAGFANLIFGLDIKDERTIGWIIFVNGIFTALIVLWLHFEKKKGTHKIPEENTLMFIPVTYWPLILIASGISKII